MMVNKLKFISIAVVLGLAAAQQAAALQMPGVVAGEITTELSAQSYLVMDTATGEVLASKEPEKNWVPASLTKLVTALVFLDTKPNLNKIVTMQKSDQVGGGCSVGGACISTKPGIKYKLSDLFRASLIASANNATMAEARSTGLSQEKFVARMNAKAKELGATNTVFYEPTGMDPRNVTTAIDYAKIVKAAFSNPQIAKIAQLQDYTFVATNSKKYVHKLKTTNKLLNDVDLAAVLGKTGYLEESRYNFAADVKDRVGNDFIVVVFGSQSSQAQFRETKELAIRAGLAKAFASTLVPKLLSSISDEPKSITFTN